MECGHLFETEAEARASIFGDDVSPCPCGMGWNENDGGPHEMLRATNLFRSFM